jgi:hypothetical protein
VKDAEDNDPKLLKERIRELEKAASTGSAKINMPPPPSAEQLQAADQAGYTRGLRIGFSDGWDCAIDDVSKILDAAHAQALAQRGQHAGRGAGHNNGIPMPFQPGKNPVNTPEPVAGDDRGRAVVRERTRAATSPEPRVVRGVAGSSPDGMASKPMPRAFLTALAQHPRGLTKGQVRIHTGYSDSGPVSTCFAQLAAAGYTRLQGALLTITPTGIAALGPIRSVATGCGAARSATHGQSPVAHGEGAAGTAVRRIP